MDDELTPQQAERVRRLLAEARHTEPVPEDVVTRLDRVLADLATDPEAQPTTAAPVVRLAERRRKAGRLLLAAAAVVVGGVAAGQWVGEVGGGGAESGADESAPASDRLEDQALPAPERGSNDDGEVRSGEAEGPRSALSDYRRSISGLPPQRLRPERFATDAEELRPSATARRDADRDGASSSEAPQGGATAESCSPGSWGGGRYVRVVFDREAGWLIYRRPRGDTQIAEVFLCDSDVAERSVTLPYG